MKTIAIGMVLFGLGLALGTLLRSGGGAAEVGPSEDPDARGAPEATEPASPIAKPQANPSAEAKREIDDLDRALNQVVRSEVEPHSWPIRGRAIRGDGEPWSGVVVRLTPAGSPPGDAAIEIERNSLEEYIRRRVVLYDFQSRGAIELVTDSEGRFECAELLADWFKVEVVGGEAEIFVEGRKYSWVEPGQSIEIRDRAEGRLVRFDLVTSSGEPPLEAMVWFSSPLSQMAEGGVDWSPEKPVLEVPEGTLSFSVNADNAFNVKRVFPDGATEIRVELRSARHIAFSIDFSEIQLPEGSLALPDGDYDYWDPDTPSCQVLWCPAPPGGDLSEEELLLDGAPSRAGAEFKLGPLLPGRYSVGLLFPGTREFAWKDLISVENESASVEVSLPSLPESDSLEVTLVGFEGDVESLHFSLVNESNGVGFQTRANPIDSNRVQLRVPNSVAFEIMAGRVSGQLKLTAESSAQRATTVVTSRQVAMEFPALIPVTVTVRGGRADLALFGSLSGDLGSDSADDSVSPRRLRFDVPAGEYRLEIAVGTPAGQFSEAEIDAIQEFGRMGRAEVWSGPVLVQAGGRELDIELPPIASLVVRFDFEVGGVSLRSSRGLNRSWWPEGLSRQARFDHLPYGRYDLFVQSEPPQYMSVELAGDAVVDFKPASVNAIELIERSDYQPELDLRAGDRLFEIAGQRFDDIAELQAIVEDSFRSGPKPIRVLRAGEKVELLVSLPAFFGDQYGPWSFRYDEGAVQDGD